MKGLLTKLGVTTATIKPFVERPIYIEKLRMSLMLGFQFPKHDK